MVSCSILCEICDAECLRIDCIRREKKFYTTCFFFISGYFLCPKCNVHGDWNILERLVKKAKVEANIKDFIEKCQKQSEEFQKDWQTIANDTTAMTHLNETQLLDLFRLFEFPVSISSFIHEIKSLSSVLLNYILIFTCRFYQKTFFTHCIYLLTYFYTI